MTLNASGPISIAGTITGESIQIELGGNGTTTMSLNDAAVRTLAGVASGAISIPTDFYGKANEFAFAITANQTNADLATLATNAGWNGTTKVVATLNSNVYISSTSTGTPALTVPNSFPNGVELVNNGFIMGMGGNGGNHSWGSANVTNGAAGGPAISISRNITITNTSGYIGGGGGGGGTSLAIFVATGGGGAGGGAGGNSLNSGGSGGGVGSPGGTGGSSWLVGCGGGGGRIIPGTGGGGATSSQAGVGGPGGGAGGGGGARAGQPGDESYDAGSAGGGGGGYGASGGNGRSGQGNPTTAGAGGSAGSAGETVGGSGPAYPSSGGGGGNGVSLNGNTVTWVGGGASTSRVYGAIA